MALGFGEVGGTPGTRYRNDTGRFLYQLVVSWINSCGQCIQYDHKLAKFWAIPLHPGCRCKQVLVKPGELAEPFVDFREEVRKLDEKERTRVVGKANLQLIEAGIVGWDDVVTPSRIRDFRDVVLLQDLDAKDLKRAGVSPGVAARALQYASAARAELRGASAGPVAAEARAKVAARIASRVGVRSLPPRPKPPPTPAGPAPPAPPARPVPPPAKGGPQPVSRSVEVEPGRPDLRATVEAIDRVHRVEGLPRHALRQGTRATDAPFRKPGTLGFYDPSRREAVVRRGIDHPRTTAAHELGHAVQAHMPAPLSGDALAAWRNAVAGSDAVRSMAAIFDEVRRTRGRYRWRSAAGEVEARVDPAWCRYTLQWDELWARSYAQWIAGRSGDDAMLAGVAARSGSDYPPTAALQWSDADFAAIGRALDDFFRGLGWLIERTTTP